MMDNPLNWHRPAALEDARALLLRFPDAVPMGGGQHLIPRWQQSETPGTIVSLSLVPAMRGIERSGHTLRIGAAVTLSELAGSAVIMNSLPALSSLAGNMGDRFMRNRATLGGALCTTSQAGCIPAAMLGTKAVVHTTARDIASQDWFRPHHAGRTLEKGELIVGVSLEIPDAASHQCLRLVPGRFALLTVFATRTGHEFGVGISGLAASAFRAFAAEAWLAGGTAVDEALGRMLQEHPARSDIYAGSAYRQAQTRRLLIKTAAALIAEAPCGPSEM
ncbi:FAD binding domain-containing protein [Castellaniella sp. GW247-6E4]|uniref:FAD binding domain-containing protein n=1 Tax=Castellaniella sp. GW247-6E4 TaxID=3140380 RepID=UPI0033156810